MSVEAPETLFIVDDETGRVRGIAVERQTSSFNKPTPEFLKTQIVEALGHHGIKETLKIQPALPEILSVLPEVPAA